MRALSLSYDSHTDLPKALKDSNIEASQSILIQIFCPADAQSQLPGLIGRIRAQLPNALLVGASSAAALHRGSIKERSVIVSILAFDTAEIRIASIDLVPGQLHDMAEIGEQLGRRCIGPSSRMVFCYAAGRGLNAESLAQGLTHANPTITLGGGIASSSDEKLPGWILADNTLITYGAVVASIAAPKLHIEAFHSNDWMMLGTPMKVTKSERNVVYRINDSQAQAIYQHYLGDEAMQSLGRSCLRFPLLSQRNGKVFARCCNGGHDGLAINLWGHLSQGEEIRFGILDPVSAMDAFHGYTRKIQQSGSQALLMFPSLARHSLMRSLTEDEGRQLQSLATTSGCFCNSQFFYQPHQPDYLHYAQTIFSLREGELESASSLDPATLNQFSQDTLQLRALSRLLGSTTREMEENNRALEELASTDPLTGALNRYKMQILLEQEHKRVQRYGRPLSLIMFDLDHFKDINDQHGHQTGDRVLECTAQIVKDSIRDTDYMARWGGEEFLVLCPETGLAGTTEIAERLRRNLANARFAEGISVTASIGVTAFQSEDSLARLLKRADQALYMSKKKGRDCVTVID